MPHPADGAHAFTNRLANETSPYLLQHAHNPVDWYPWGDAAFAKAKAEGKPIFLSIGYSTCHWCHVMERETFEVPQIGAYLNERFVCIKVDREERPDVDHIYMQFTQAFLGGGGGWPMSVWMTAERQPFFAGTYFPPDNTRGRPSFRDVCEHVLGIWNTKREEVDRITGTEVPKLFRELPKPAGDGVNAIADELPDGAADLLLQGLDPQWGGFGGGRYAPKFPTPHQLQFLLRRHFRTGDAATLAAVVQTLDAMAQGGIHDHVGGGFHRYSTDREWLVPHFEKMLYDQAGLLQAYVEAYQVTGHERFADAARGIVTYVLRDLHDAGGGFHSAEDADSEGEEGKFYVWSLAELQQVLGDADAVRFAALYRCNATGNWTDEASGHALPTNIPHRRGEIPAAQAADFAAMRATLLAVRAQRVRPLLDDKVLTSWNGMFIGALAIAGRALDEPTWIAAAEAAAQFLLTTHRRADGRLLRSSRHGVLKNTLGYLDDYAFLSAGLLELHQATGNARWLQEAATLARAMPGLFGRDGGGLLYFTGSDAEALITRPVETYDGATPAGNSVAALTCLRLGQLLDDRDLSRVAGDILRHMAEPLRFQGVAYTALQMAVDRFVHPAREVVLAGAPGADDLAALRRVVARRFLPDTVVAVHATGDAGAATRTLLPFVAAQGPVDGAAAAYVCQNFTCQAPVTEPARLADLVAAPAGK